VGAAEAAIEALAGELELDALSCAEGIVRVANAEMVRALRVVTVERGIDPRDYALLAFGGAGPLHAAGIADELGIDSILCPRASGVLAALGLVVSPRRRDAQRTVLLSGAALTAEAIATAVDELGERARRELGAGAEAELRATYELRYLGQSFELPVEGGANPTPDELRRAFEAAHEHRYGYSDPDQALELVTIRVSASSPGAEVALAAGDEQPAPQRGRRAATISGERLELEVVRGSPEPGTRIEGPAVLELAESTLLVPPGWHVEVDRTGTIGMRRAR
jgi:N-methylhydantoinase A